MAFLVVSLNSIATGCFKEGTQWVCEVVGTHNPNGYQYKYVYAIEGHTVINNKIYMKLYRASDESLTDKILVNCLRKDGDKIYFLAYKGANEDVLMYDFGMQEGEIANIGLMPYFWSDTSKTIMTTIKCVGYSTHTFDDKEYEIMNMEEYNNDGHLLGSGQWIKGMSSIYGLDGNGYFIAEGISVAQSDSRWRDRLRC